MDHIEQILVVGKLRPNNHGVVSFTEIPIGELDRMKYRHGAAEQVAIGFPRRYIQSLGLTPVWYLKHNPGIKKVFAELKARDKQGYEELSPFIDEKGDVSSFQEVRTKGSVNVEEAVWILTTKRGDDSPPLKIPGIEEFQREHGRISKSYWHRSHQLEILSEWQFTATTENDQRQLEDFQVIGEHYWRQRVMEEKELRVTLPVDEKGICFDLMKLDKHAAYRGPWSFVDVARSIAKILFEAGEDAEDALRYRLIGDITRI